MKNLKMRLGSHFAAAAAVAAVSAVGGAAQAAIVSSGPVNIAIPVTTAGVYLNVVTGANSPAPASAPGWDLNPWGSSGFSVFSPSAPTGGTYVGSSGYYNLSLGALIDASSTYSATTGISATTPNPLNFNSDNNYLGFRFLNESTSTVQYGWAQIRLGATATDPARAIVAYAYENTGAGIGAGVVPAPGALALMGLGGLVVGRRRR